MIELLSVWLFGWGVAMWFDTASTGEQCKDDLTDLQTKFSHINEYCQCECKPPPMK